MSNILTFNAIVTSGLLVDTVRPVLPAIALSTIPMAIIAR
jgi:hypothetical protein